MKYTSRGEIGKKQGTYHKKVIKKIMRNHLLNKYGRTSKNMRIYNYEFISYTKYANTRIFSYIF